MEPGGHDSFCFPSSGPSSVQGLNPPTGSTSEAQQRSQFRKPQLSPNALHPSPPPCDKEACAAVADLPQGTRHAQPCANHTARIQRGRQRGPWPWQRDVSQIQSKNVERNGWNVSLTSAVMSFWISRRRGSGCLQSCSFSWVWEGDAFWGICQPSLLLPVGSIFLSGRFTKTPSPEPLLGIAAEVQLPRKWCPLPFGAPGSHIPSYWRLLRSCWLTHWELLSQAPTTIQVRSALALLCPASLRSPGDRHICTAKAQCVPDPGAPQPMSKRTVRGAAQRAFYILKISFLM